MFQRLTKKLYMKLSGHGYERDHKERNWMFINNHKQHENFHYIEAKADKAQENDKCR